MSGSPSRPPGSRILVVDDSVDSAETLAELLKIWGHDVHLAHDGPAAVAAAREYKPEIVLLDIGLPGMDGYQVARKLREQAGSSLMLIALTGYARDEDRRRSRRAGFDHHLVKPVALDELQGLLTRLEPLARPAADPRA